MKRNSTRLLSWLLTLAMVLALLPAAALAEEALAPAEEPKAAETSDFEEEPKAEEAPELEEEPEAAEAPDPEEEPEAAEAPDPEEEPKAEEAPELEEEPKAEETPELEEEPAPQPEEGELMMEAASALTIPGYTQVAEMPADGLDPEKYYIIVSKDTAGNFFALYPNVTTVGPGNLPSVGAASRYAAALTVNDQTVTAQIVNGAAVDMSDLYLTAEKSGEGYIIGSGEKYLNMSSSVFAATTTALNVSFSEGALVIENGGRYLDFSKNGEGQFSTFGTDFWGPAATHVPVYLMVNDSVVPPTAKDALQALVTELENENLDPDSYSGATWNALQTALSAAQALLDDASIAGNDQRCKDALSALREAKNGLQPAPTTPELPGAATVYVQDTDGIDIGGIYAIYTNESTDNQNRILYHTGTGTTDKVGGSVGSQVIEGKTQNVLTLNSDFAANRQLWMAESTSDGIALKSMDSNRYLDLSSTTTAKINTSDSPVALTIAQDGETYTVGKDGTFIAYKSGNGTYYAGSEAAPLRLFKQMQVTPDRVEWQDMAPQPGDTTDAPFNAGTGGSSKYRIPSLISLKSQSDSSKNGRLVAAIDARWNHTSDACGLDTILSYSDDNGATWHYAFPNYFGDSTNAYNVQGTAFIDPVMVEGNDGAIYLMVDLYPGGVAINTVPQSMYPAAATGYVEIKGKQRLALYTTNDPTASQTDTNYSYYVGDFVNGYAAIYDSFSHEATSYYVDEYYYLYQGDRSDIQSDKLWCERLGNSDIIQQNVFFYNACLHVRNASYLWLIKSTDGGETWSKPMMLNSMVRTGADIFYGVGPGAGLCFTDAGGREVILLPTYTHITGSTERAGFIYSSDGGVTWKRADDATTSDWSSESFLVQLDATTARHFYRDGHNELRYTDHTWNPSAKTFTRSGEPTLISGATKTTGNQMSGIKYSQKINGKDAYVISTAASGSGSRTNGKLYVLLLNEDKTMDLGGFYEVTASGVTYAYSSIAETADGDIAVLYEGDSSASVFRIIPWEDFTLAPDVEAAGFSGAYDGQPHGITVTAPAGATVEYSLVEGGPYYSQSFTFTEAGTYTVYYRVTSGTFTITGSEKVVISGGGSSGGGGGGGSSGNTASTTTTNPDGTKTTTTITKGGAISQTTPQPDGSQLNTVMEPDGTVTRTVTQPDGSAAGTTTKLDGTVIQTTKDADGLEVSVTTKPEEDTAVSVTLPKDMASATVTVPLAGDEADYGLVAVDAKTGQVLTLCVPTEEGMTMRLEESAELILVDRSKKFEDMEGHWAEDAVNFTAARGIFNGTTETVFSPEMDMTRGMMVTILARFDGADTSAGDTWYEAGAAWATEQGVSDGTNLDQVITREQLVTMLWRYAGSPEAAGSLEQFGDAGSVSSFAETAMLWGVENGILKGFGDGRLAPLDNASRAQVSTVMLRFLQYMVEA